MYFKIEYFLSNHFFGVLSFLPGVSVEILHVILILSIPVPSIRSILQHLLVSTLMKKINSIK